MHPLLACALPALLATAQASPLPVMVDPRFELIAIVFRLAGYQEYGRGQVADYNAAVDAHFGAHKDHPAIHLAQELRKKRMGYSDGPFLAVRVKDALGFEPQTDFAKPGILDGTRWTPEDAARFCKAMAAFALEAKADAFFRVQAPFYARLTEACRTGLVAHLDQAWFLKAFGPGAPVSFTVVVAPLFGGGNSAAHLSRPGGGEQTFAFLGTDPAGKGHVPTFTAEALPTLVHEFAHSFVNPWVDRHLEALLPSGKALNAPVLASMRRQAYGTGELALKESLVRAFTIRYLEDQGRTIQALNDQHEQVLRDFYWVRPLVGLLRESAGTLEAKTRRVLAAFKDWAGRTEALRRETAQADAADQDRLYAAGPKLVSLEPAPGTRDLDPASAVLRLRFDRPMGRAMTVAGTGGRIPDIEDDGTWSEGGRVLTFRMKLAPATNYRFWFNLPFRLGFRDQEGRPLRPTEVTFTTR